MIINYYPSIDISSVYRRCRCDNRQIRVIYNESLYARLEPNMTHNDQKTDSLSASGTLNRHPGKIQARRFQNGGFFDPRDMLQVRYEMVRSAETAKLAEVAEDFGVSVPTCIRNRRRFREGGLQALISKPRGPRKPHKVTDEIIAFIETYRAENGPVGARRLVPVIENRFGVRVHPRSITKAFERLKKNFGADPQGVR